MSQRFTYMFLHLLGTSNTFGFQVYQSEFMSQRQLRNNNTLGPVFSSRNLRFTCNIGL